MDYVCARLYEFLGLLHIPKRSPTSIVDEYRSEEQDEEQPITLLALPTELLVHIISFISTTRDRAKLRCVQGDYEVSSKHRHCGGSLCGLTTTLLTKAV